jgi:hypothetical protein
MKKKVVVFGALDIEGAFDSTSCTIIETARWHGLEDTSCQRSVLKKNPL